MIDMGFPHEEDVMNPHATVFSFPVRSPKTSVFRDDRTSVQELEFWKMYRQHWCDHNPSVTITVREHEWPEVGAWVWGNFDEICGVSFLPHSDHSYRQAPYEEVSLEVIEELEKSIPKSVDFSLLYEEDDETTSSQELACTGNACEIV
jgi:ribonucleoside-diphosphate reductase alpha chain